MTHLLLLTFLWLGVVCGEVQTPAEHTGMCYYVTTRRVIMTFPVAPIIRALPDEKECVLYSCTPDGLACREIIVDCGP